MPPRDFLARIGRLVREQVDEDLREFDWSVMSFMAKLWYGSKDLHYEIWVRERLRTIEIGLHFESDPLTNARLLARFKASARELRRALPTARIEAWDRGWARVWEPIPLRTRDVEFASELAERVASYVTTLEPILRRELPSDVAWSEPTARPARVTAAGRSRTSRGARR